MDRFFCPTLSSGTTVTLADDEFHHLAHVLRVKQGERVQLFDGQGQSAEAIVERLTKRDALLSIAGEFQRDASASIPLILGVACPKGDRLKWLVEKATELGVTELVPLQCERSVVEPRETKLAKLEQTVLSACKQCRRNTLMPIGELQSLNDFIRADPDRVWIAHPGGRPTWDLVGDMRADQSDAPIPLRVAIGPEGGFTAPEVDQALAHGAHAVSLGRNVLRVETAALAVAALILGIQRDAAEKPRFSLDRECQTRME